MKRLIMRLVWSLLLSVPLWAQGEKDILVVEEDILVTSEIVPPTVAVPVPEMTPEDKQILDARYVLRASQNWVWLGNKVLNDTAQQVKKIQLASPYKGNAQLVLSVYRNERDGKGNVMLLVRFRNWKDINAEKGVDGRYYADVKGQFDTLPGFRLQMRENGARNIFTLGYNKGFQLFKKNGTQYGTYLDLLIHSNELALQYTAHFLSADSEKVSKIIFDLRGAEAAIDAALVLLQASETCEQIMTRYNKSMINERRRLDTM